VTMDHTIVDLARLTPGHEWQAMHGFPHSNARRYQTQYGMLGLFVKSADAGKTWSAGYTAGGSWIVTRHNRSPVEAVRGAMWDLRQTIKELMDFATEKD